MRRRSSGGGKVFKISPKTLGKKWKLSEETKQKMRKPKSLDHCKKISLSKIGNTKIRISKYTKNTAMPLLMQVFCSLVTGKFIFDCNSRAILSIQNFIKKKSTSSSPHAVPSPPGRRDLCKLTF